MLLIRLWLFQCYPLHGDPLQFHTRDVLSASCIQGVLRQRKEHALLFCFRGHQKAAERPARLCRHQRPVILKKRIFRRNIFRQFFVVCGAEDNDLFDPQNTGNIFYFVPAQAFHRFDICCKCSKYFFFQLLHLLCLFSSQGVWGLPQNARGYPRAMLAKPVAPPSHRNCFIVTVDKYFIIQYISNT